MSARHAFRRPPRGHWLLLFLIIPAVTTALLFEGWTTHEVDAAQTKAPCTRPVPQAADDGDPVLRLTGDSVETVGMPAGTAALTFDGGPDPTWTPRLLDLLREHHARATFFLGGSQAARHPELVRQIRAAGHDIGSYTYTGGDLGVASPIRSRLELSLTQTALAGAAGVNTRLLRLPHTTTPDTLCGAEWQAARRAAGEGYLLVAADPRSAPPSQGVVRQFSQSALGYREARALLEDPSVERFTTVSAGLGRSSLTTDVSPLRQIQGQGLLWAQDVGRFLAHSMAWVLLVAGGLALLRLVLLFVLARVQVRRRRRGSHGPRLPEVNEPVSVLVPAHNEEAGIAATVRSLLASTHTDLQVIVIDDGSTDRTAEIAESIPDPRVTVIRQPNGGKPGALNTGLRYARHGIVVMVDADTVFEPEALHRLIQPLAHSGVGAVSGNTKVGNRRRLLGRWQHLEYVLGFNLDRRMFEVLECMPTVPGAIGAFRRDALVSVGGVSDETLAEDTDLTMSLWRANWRVVYEETAIAWTEVPSSLRQLWRQRFRWCFGTLQAMWKHRRAMVEMGSAGRFGRRGLSYLGLFQILLPLLAPVVDVYALYGGLFRESRGAVAVWLLFLGVQMVTAAYALRLDGERLRVLWALPFQLVVYRQLLYLVVVQSVVTALLGNRLRWQTIRRSGTADEHLTHEALATPAPTVTTPAPPVASAPTAYQGAGAFGGVPGGSAPTGGWGEPAGFGYGAGVAGAGPAETAARPGPGAPDGAPDDVPDRDRGGKNLGGKNGGGRNRRGRDRNGPGGGPGGTGSPSRRDPGGPGRQRRTRRRRPLRWALLTLVMVLVGTPLGTYAWATSELNQVVDLNAYGDRPAASPGTTYLIVGSDSREGLSARDRSDLRTGDAGGRRADVMMLLHTGANGTTMVSLPRDSWITIPDFVRPSTGKRTGPRPSKLNAAFSEGGPELLAHTVEHNTGVRIDHYAEVGFGGFVDIVDAIGGVRMCLDRAIRDENSGADLAKGCQKLDGAQSLAFVRQRHQESEGDLGRTRNQQKFLAALANQAGTADTLANPTKVYPSVRAGLDTLTVDRGMELPDLAEMLRALRRVTDGHGRQMNVPVSGVGVATSQGSAIRWDEERAGQLFDELRQDRRVTVRDERGR